MADKLYCPVQRVNLSEEDIKNRTAKCPRPKCGRTIRIVPNVGLKQATMKEHVTGAENLAK